MAHHVDNATLKSQKSHHSRGRHPRRDFKFIANGLSELITFRRAEIDGYWAPGVLCRSFAGGGDSRMEFDVPTERAYPDSQVMRLVAKRHRLWLEKQLRLRALANWFETATVSIEFTLPGAVRDYSLWPIHIGMTPDRPLYRFEVRAIVTDDNGRVYQGENHGWCWPHDPRIELRSANSTSPGALAGGSSAVDPAS